MDLDFRVSLFLRVGVALDLTGGRTAAGVPYRVSGYSPAILYIGVLQSNVRI